LLQPVIPGSPEVSPIGILVDFWSKIFWKPFTLPIIQNIKYKEISVFKLLNSHTPQFSLPLNRDKVLTKKKIYDSHKETDDKAPNFLVSRSRDADYSLTLLIGCIMNIVCIV